MPAARAGAPAGPQAADPRDVVDALAASRTPYLLGVRHHSPALAAVVPQLLDASGADVVCVELPADFQPWLEHLADPETEAPVALAGTGAGGRLAFYPFADFSPELAAIRWARRSGAAVVCCDLPLGSPGWTPADQQPAAPVSATVVPSRSYADALAAAGTGRDGDDLWDRAVEVLAPGCTPEAVRRAALGVGWALREDSAVPSEDLAREAHMREVIAAEAATGRRVAAVIGAFHAPALTHPPTDAGRPAPAEPNAGRDGRGNGPVAPHAPGTVAPSATSPEAVPATSGATGSVPPSVTAPAPLPGTAATPEAAPATSPGAETSPGMAPGAVPVPAAGAATSPVPASATSPGAPSVVAPAASASAVTSLVPYSYDLLDSRSGYPAGIRDPLWQQAVLRAAGDPVKVREAASVAVTGLCRELRRAGHTAGTGEAAETLRLACDLAVLRGLPAPGRGELLEAVTTVLGQGEPLGRGRALARALEAVFVGTARGRVTPHAPRSGLGPSVEAELAELRLPSPEDPAPREMRLDPLRSPLDGRREVLLQRLLVCGASYGEPLTVAATGEGAALGTKWRLSWTPSVPARLDLAGVRGVTAAQAAAGTLRESARRAAAEGGPTPAAILAGLAAAARCDLPELVGVRLREAATALPQTATLPELLDALDLLEALRRGHLPGTCAASRATATALTADLLEAAVRCLPGLAGSEDPADAAALVALTDRAAAHHLGVRLDEALAELARAASPLMQGAALAVRVLLDLDPAAALGDRTAGWVDGAGTPDGRRALTRRLGGLLTAAGPLLQSSPAALTPLLDRVEHLGDQEFLDRLPALRGGFDALAPAARDRLLDTVAERLGDRPDLTLDASPALLALWAAADAAGLAALKSLPLPGSDARAVPPAPLPDTEPETEAATAPAPDAARIAPAPDAARIAPAPDAARIAPADRWRLLLGRERDRLPAGARRYAHALDELYGAGRGEGSAGLDGGSGGAGGGQEAAFPTAREWSEELESLFGADVREEVLAGAAEAGRTDVLTQLDPASVRPSVELLSSVLSLAGGLPESRLARLRPLVKRLVDELAKELATRLRPALSGLSTPRPTRRPGGRIDLARTLRANLAHTRRQADGSVVVVPERPVFSTRASREADWRLILVVDVSGSMEASVIWSALTAAVLGGVPTLSTHFLAFSTQVVDLTDRVEDPLSLLLEVRVGGGTHIAAGLAHARSLITVPSRTLVVVVSDFEEGAPVGGLLGEVRALAASGAHLLGCAALDDAGTPRYSVPVARQLVAAGMPVAALSPLALARWVGDRLRGEPR
ncbi:vWA domain-containing protein [Streptomyces xanthophaeus]|uniref:vWA domain-containing protein n=1 Tax=Streptomyces xanthophaeus TaxID=67385 RepID=UPI00386A90B3